MFKTISMLRDPLVKMTSKHGGIDIIIIIITIIFPLGCCCDNCRIMQSGYYMAHASKGDEP